MKKPKILKREPDPVMPTPDDEVIKMAKKREIAKRLKKGGRISTVLTQKNREKLGVQDYGE